MQPPSAVEHKEICTRIVQQYSTVLCVGKEDKGGASLQGVVEHAPSQSWAVADPNVAACTRGSTQGP